MHLTFQTVLLPGTTVDELYYTGPRACALPALDSHGEAKTFPCWVCSARLGRGDLIFFIQTGCYGDQAGWKHVCANGDCFANREVVCPNKRRRRHKEALSPPTPTRTNRGKESRCTSKNRRPRTAARQAVPAGASREGGGPVSDYKLQGTIRTYVAPPAGGGYDAARSLIEAGI